MINQTSLKLKAIHEKTPLGKVKRTKNRLEKCTSIHVSDEDLIPKILKSYIIKDKPFNKIIKGLNRHFTKIGNPNSC